jgi:putative DNA primase/helicase
VADWIQSKPWDGTTRLGELFATVQAGMDVRLKNTLIYRWMLSAVAAIFVPHGFKARGVLVFTGRQGIGKTTWIKSLVPEEMGLVLEGATLDPNNKDTVINAVAHWLVELGELDATFRKADIARLKSFLTMANDKLRRPYDRVESEYQRRTVFFASVNESQYLVDDTGNSRWWTVPVTSIDYKHGLDMQQIWAELYFHFKVKNAQWWLTPAEEDQLAALNLEHENTDPIEEKILRAFDWSGEGFRTDLMTASEVLMAIGIDQPNKSQATHASKILKRLTGAEPERKKNGRFFTLPRRLYGKPKPDDDSRPL